MAADRHTGTGVPLPTTSMSKLRDEVLGSAVEIVAPLIGRCEVSKRRSLARRTGGRWHASSANPNRDRDVGAATAVASSVPLDCVSDCARELDCAIHRERAVAQQDCPRRRRRRPCAASLNIRALQRGIQHVALAGNRIRDRDDALRLHRHEGPDSGELVLRARAAQAIPEIPHRVRASDAIAVRSGRDDFRRAHARVGRALQRLPAAGPAAR